MTAIATDTALTRFRAMELLPTAVRLIGTDDVPADARRLSELYRMVRTVYGSDVVPYAPADVQRFPYWDRFDNAKVLQHMHEYRISKCGVERKWSWGAGEGRWLAAAVATLILRLED